MLSTQLRFNKLNRLGDKSQDKSQAAVLSEKPGAKSPQELGLPVGEKPDFEPELQITDSSISELVETFRNKKPLFVTDKYNYETVSKFGPTVLVESTNPEDVHKILNMAEYPSRKWVVGVGGCAALDIAKAASVKKDLAVIPTLLSTNCITKNRSVLGEGLDAFSYQTQTPKSVLVSLSELDQTKQDVKEHWTQSGWGDFFAKISAMIDQSWEKGETASLETMKAKDQKVVEGLDWVNESFDGYNRKSLEHLAHTLHDAGVQVVDAGRNDISIGGEHKFYKAMMNDYPHLRHLPSHGQIVAVGTLITVAAYAKETKQPEMYNKVRSAFQKLSIPTSYQELEKVGISRDIMEKSIEAIAPPRVKKTYLGTYFQDKNYGLLDDVFGKESEPWLVAG